MASDYSFFKTIEGIQFAGTHLLLDLYDCEFGLDDEKFIEDTLQQCVTAVGATLILLKTHKFTPSGVSGVAVLAESHISIHTWPDNKFAALDVFTCGKCDPLHAVPVLQKAFQVGTLVQDIVNRGRVGRTLPKGILPSRLFENTVDGWYSAFDLNHVLHYEDSELQSAVVMKNDVMGTCLILDKVCQVTDLDQFIYHEMLTHVPILAHGNVKKVLVIGGGDGGTIREVLRHPGVEQVTLVEIDRQVIDMCLKYMPHISAGAFDNPRLKLRIEDGAAFVRDTTERFDAIMVDSSDPVGPNQVLFSKEFYANCHRSLTPGGVLTYMNGTVVKPAMKERVRKNSREMKEIFNDFTFYLCTVPTYPGGTLTVGWATDNVALRNVPVEVLQERFKKLGISTEYYTTLNR